ncbi:mercuric transporter MerT family protein [Fulvivirga kasyanovii]|uniref:Mercuric transport protein MerT n=1 Tax=Fulvivirga kasyanovii TaxID=396812 RepID=A0ABW9RQW5_9BACT|nr:mercuric transporter MerT family protein [Fulvivirga kasyanovii]MTI26558.1 hypothetical protein [Fulvivirga kasyanovii]HNP16910.1 mercuric transporter MerT family protein [Fulvivirga sp.]
MKKNALLGLSLTSAIAPFFCCWGPAIIVGIAGFSGTVTWFSWLHPMRPYLYALAFLSLGFSFYQAYGSKKNNQSCENCKKTKNKSMLSQVFLWITALVVFSMFVLNYSSNLF